jgi:hypothetical protein
MPKNAKTKKNKAAAATSAAASMMSSSRWAKPEWKDPKKRSEFGAMISALGDGKRTGRPRQEHNRCYCGANTMNRAKAHRFACCRKSGHYRAA